MCVNFVLYVNMFTLNTSNYKRVNTCARYVTLPRRNTSWVSDYQWFTRITSRTQHYCCVDTTFSERRLLVMQFYLQEDYILSKHALVRTTVYLTQCQGGVGRVLRRLHYDSAPGRQSRSHFSRDHCIWEVPL